MKYPNYNIYEELYKRYFKRDAKELIHLTKINQTDEILDLCGGTGRLSKCLLNYTNHITYVDQEKDMTRKELKNTNIKIYHQTIQNFLEKNEKKYDKVFCQQAINYWFLSTNIEKLNNIIKPNGVFIFNTFYKKPSTKPRIKEYKIKEKQYLEISYLINHKVHHVQIEEGIPPHITTFDWIEENTFDTILSPYFTIKKRKEGNTLIYICTKK